MPTVAIELISIICSETEDITGADEIYAVGGIAAVGPAGPGEPTKLKFQHASLPRQVSVPPAPGAGGHPSVSQPTHSMNDGDTWLVNDTLVKAVVPFGKCVAAIWLYDQDAEADVEVSDADEVAAVLETAGSALAPVTNGVSAAAGLLAGLIVRLGARLMSMDEDDLLGSASHELYLPVPIGNDPFVQQYAAMYQYPQAHVLHATLDGADYTVFYRIHVQL